MANIANVKVKSGNVLELSGSSVSISGSGGLNLHTQNGGIVADAGTGKIELTASSGVGIDGNLVVQGNITAERLDIVETTVSSSILFESGSTRFGNDSLDNHQFTGSVLVSGSVTIEAGSGQYNGSGAGLTSIPNGALDNSAITINGQSTSLGGSITTVGAGNGLAEAAPVSGEIALSVQLSGSDSGLVVDGGGVKLSGSVARLDRDANFGANAVTASTFVGALNGTATNAAKTEEAVTFTSAGGDAAGISFNGSTARTVGYQTLGAATTGSANTFSGLQTFSTALSASAMTGSAALIGTLTLENDLGVAHGGTGLDGSSAANGQLLIGNGSGYTLATLTTGSDKVTITNGAGSISIDVDSAAIAGDFVTITSDQTITGVKSFNANVKLQQSIDLEGILNVSAAATGSVTSAHSVVLAADNSEVELPAVDDGRLVIVKKSDSGTSAKGVLVKANGVQTIDGDSNYGLYGPFQSITLLGSGSAWFVL